MIVFIFIVSLLTRRSFDRDLTRISRQLTSLENNNNSTKKNPKNEDNEPLSATNKDKEVISMATIIGKKLGLDNKSVSCGNFSDAKPPKQVSDLQISRLSIARSRNSSTNNNNASNNLNQVDETMKL